MRLLRYAMILYFLVLAVPWQAEAQESTYVNRKYGFSITPPKDWVKVLEKDEAGYFNISFAPSQEGDFPVFGIMVKPPPYPVAKDPLDLASQVFSYWKTSESRYEIAETPREIEVGGIKGARFQWDKPAWDSIHKKESWVRILQVYFRKEKRGKIFEISLFSWRDDFEKSYKNVEPVINSFKFVENTLTESSSKYVNEQDQFEITVPHGWFQHESKGRIIFTKQSTQELTLPVLGVITDTAPPNIQTVLEFAKSALYQYQLSAEQRKGTLRIIESPKEIEVNGCKGARFVYERVGQSGAMKSIDCKFMRGDFVVSLQGMDYSETFDESLKSFEEAIQTFRFK